MARMTSRAHPAMSGLLRVYEPDELGRDGYPLAWHRCSECDGDGLIPYGLPDADDQPVEWDQCVTCLGCGSIKNLIREQAGHRCVRCGHPYRVGDHGSGEWSPCDDECRHGGPVRWSNGGFWEEYDGPDKTVAGHVEARWRILTVHHLTGEKADCRWWNLAALCQRCHLTVQGRVVMERAFILEHSDWFKPYAAGWYAWKYGGLELDRTETLARLDELLDLERIA